MDAYSVLTPVSALRYLPWHFSRFHVGSNHVDKTMWKSNALHIVLFLNPHRLFLKVIFYKAIHNIDILIIIEDEIKEIFENLKSSFLRLFIMIICSWLQLLLLIESLINTINVIFTHVKYAKQYLYYV